MNRLSLIKRDKPAVLSFSLALSLLFAGLGAGCRVVHTAATSGRKEKPADPVEVQQALLRFANEYSARMVLGVDKLQRGTNAPDPAEILKWKVWLATETCSIASGPNAVANLLDMTAFVTVMRMALEEHWQPKVFGESALPMLESSRNAETEIWRLAGTVLTTNQQTELRRGIEEWRTRNPLPESVLAARSLGFASQVAEASKTDTARPDSVFSLLRVDPLAGMDPAVREIAQTRLLAERALFVTQQMPTLLRWQTELLSVNAGAEILKVLESQEKQLTPLVNEVRETLTTGTQMSTSLNTTLTTFDALMKRFGVGETNNAESSKSDAEPFRIQDYTKTAAQLEATARQLTELLVTLDRTIGSTNLAQLSAQVGPVVQQAQTSGKEVVDYAFWKGMLLVAIILIAALIYRFLVARLTPARHSH